MAIVVRARQEVDPQAMPAVRLAAAPTAQSLGAGIGQAVSGAGAEIARIGAEEKQKADNAWTTQAIGALDQAELSLVDDPKTGALRLKGHDAAGAYEPTLAEFDKRVADLRAKAASPEQQQALERLATNKRSSIASRLSRYAAGQIDAATDADTKATIATSIDLAGKNFDDPARVDSELEKQSAVIQAHAAAKGWGAPAIQQALADARSATRRQVIDGLIAAGRGTEAEAYLTKHKADLSSDTFEALRAKVKPAADAVLAQGAADEVWSTMGPKNDIAPVELDKMGAEIRKRFASEPERQKLALAALRDRASEHNAAQRERAVAAESSVWEAVVGGANARQVMALPGFQSLPGDRKDKVLQSLDERAYRDEARAAARESRAAAAEARQNAAEERAWRRDRMDPAKIEQRLLNYGRLTDPEVLSRMSRNELLTHYADVGPDLFDNLLAKHDQFEKAGAAKAAKVLEAKMDREDFRAEAARFGMDPTEVKNADKRRAMLGDLTDIQSKVENVIDAEQRARGNKPLTREEKQAIVRRFFVDVTVNAKQTILGVYTRDTTDTKKLYEVKYPENIIIPPDALSAIRAEAQRRGRTLTPEQERQAYLSTLSPTPKR